MNKQVKVDIEKAKELGKQAYVNSKPAAPAANKEVMEIVAKYSTTDFSKSHIIIKILDGFTGAWMNENLANARQVIGR